MGGTTHGSGIQTEVSPRDDEYERNEYAHIHNWLYGEMPRLATMCARNPWMADLMRDVATMFERYCDLHEIDPEPLNFYVVCTPRGQIIIDMFGDEACDRFGDIQRRLQYDMTNGAAVVAGEAKIKEGLAIIPHGDRVVVEVMSPVEKTVGGVLIPQTAKEAPQEGVIVAVGDGAKVAKFNLGDHVIFSKFSGAEMTVDGGHYLILHEQHVLSRVLR